MLFDIETIRMVVKVWGLYKQRIPPENVIKEWSICCWAAKWLGDSKIMGKTVAGDEAVARLDNSIILDIWKLINKADIIVAHNAERFDIRKLNWRFRQNGLMPPSPYLVVDTLKHSRKLFASSSHKLDYLNKQRGLSAKIQTSIHLWEGCEEGDIKSLKEMLMYCKGDIAALEDQYIDIRPWIKSHPPCGAFIETMSEVCPNCASTDLGHTTTDYITPAGRYYGVRCNSCGAVGRMMSNQFSKASRERLVRSIAR